MSRFRQFRRGQWIYLQHVIGLLLPGEDIGILAVDQVVPQTIDAWNNSELVLLIEEGRRQVDRQQADLAHIRGRAQWLFTVGAAVLAALGSALLSSISAASVTVLALMAMLLLAYGVGGAAAVLTVKADFGVIHAAVLTNAERPVQRSLASSYARLVRAGENTVAARLTVFRQAVVYCLAGGYLGLVAVLVH